MKKILLIGGGGYIGGNSCVSNFTDDSVNLLNQVIDKNSSDNTISFNGKMRFTLELSADLSKEDIEKEVMAFDKTKQYMEGKNLKRIIIVPKKIVNIVI